MLHDFASLIYLKWSICFMSSLRHLSRDQGETRAAQGRRHCTPVGSEQVLVVPRATSPALSGHDTCMKDRAAWDVQCASGVTCTGWASAFRLLPRTVYRSCARGKLGHSRARLCGRDGDLKSAEALRDVICDRRWAVFFAARRNASQCLVDSWADAYSTSYLQM